MTGRVGKVVVIAEEAPQQCDFCGKVAELRPYGPNGEALCFPCAMKNKPAAKRAFRKLLDGPEGTGEAPRG